MLLAYVNLFIEREKLDKLSLGCGGESGKDISLPKLYHLPHLHSPIFTPGGDVLTIG